MKIDKPLKRHFFKTISYRLIGTTITIITAWSFGVSLEISSLIGVGELFVKPVIYFIHERIWFKYLRFDKK